MPNTEPTQAEVIQSAKTGFRDSLSAKINFTTRDVLKAAYEAGADYTGDAFEEFLKTESAWRSNFSVETLLRLAVTNPELATERCRVIRPEAPIEGIRQNLKLCISHSLLAGWESKNS
jgi:hypothetical protein